MEVKMRSHIGTDGLLQIEMPTDLKDTSVEVTIVVEALSSQTNDPRYNAWGKLVTKESMQFIIHKMQQLRQEVGLDKNLIREMIEEGRRF